MVVGDVGVDSIFVVVMGRCKDMALGAVVESSKGGVLVALGRDKDTVVAVTVVLAVVRLDRDRQDKSPAVDL